MLENTKDFDFNADGNYCEITTHTSLLESFYQIE
jgi:hypothetical protein